MLLNSSWLSLTIITASDKLFKWARQILKICRQRGYDVLFYAIFNLKQ